MAPTEILAEQHANSLQKLLGDSVRVGLLVGSLTAAKKKRRNPPLQKNPPPPLLRKSLPRKLRRSLWNPLLLRWKHRWNLQPLQSLRRPLSRSFRNLLLSRRLRHLPPNPGVWT